MKASQALPLALVILSVGVLYFLTLPFSVQHGDTGELVTNGFLLRTSHPPGYPLFTWLVHLFTSTLPSTSIFRSASFLPMALSLGTLTICFFSGPSKFRWLTSSMLLLLASSRLFWEYSLLPDVFMLNCFFIAIVSYFYFAQETRQNLFFLLLFFCLGLTNHQTLIFLLPLVGFKVIRMREFKLTAGALSLGALVFILINLSLFLLNSSSLGSWGNINSFEKLLGHILRREYGTFSLASTSSQNNLLELLSLFFDHLSLDFWSLILLLLLSLLQWQKDKKLNIKDLVYLINFLFYIVVFFMMMKISLDKVWLAIAERFFLLPIVMFFFISLRASAKLDKKVALGASALILINLVLNFTNYFKVNDFSENYVIEDYAVNVLRPLPPNSMLIISGDTQEFALYYAQNVLRIRPDVLVVSPFMLVHPWYIAKLKKAQPKFNYPEVDTAKMFGERIFELVERNIDSMPIRISPTFFNLKLLNYYELRFGLLTIATLSKMQEKPAHVTYQCTQEDLQSRSSSRIYDEAYGFSPARYYQSLYGLCDLYAGDQKLQLGDRHGALKHYRLSGEKVGFFSQGNQKACELAMEMRVKSDPVCH